jgi:hypothetical protein
MGKDSYAHIIYWRRLYYSPDFIKNHLVVDWKGYRYGVYIKFFHPFEDELSVYKIAPEFVHAAKAREFPKGSWDDSDLIGGPTLTLREGCRDAKDYLKVFPREGSRKYAMLDMEAEILFEKNVAPQLMAFFEDPEERKQLYIRKSKLIWPEEQE